ncbi:MAG: hypothetical protein IRZ03_11850 [Acidobacterium ailaaui]|nr:hypothetical protein [Pseudacidobacterium ailaaui]
MGNIDQHRRIVKQLLDTKAVDFAAIGKAVSELGPSLAVAEEPWDFFCGTNRIFIHIYRIYNPGTPVEDLGSLAANAGELRQ